ncbi:MAG: histidine kinase dimerization/phospho-acceptor domain-containing protein [Thiobacillaceae bacterium]
MAFQWNRPITAITVNQAGVSLLDTQLARLAGLEGLLAIPIGGDTPTGVLLTCGYRGQLSQLGEEQAYLSKLGRLAAPVAGTQAAPEAAPAEPAGSWQMRSRQLAHEINNPLGIVKNYLALLRVKLGDDPATADELRIIQEELGRIARIVQSLAGEPITATQPLQAVDINALLTDLARVAAAGPRVQKGVGIDLHLDETLPELLAMPTNCASCC